MPVGGGAGGQTKSISLIIFIVDKPTQRETTHLVSWAFHLWEDKCFFLKSFLVGYSVTYHQIIPMYPKPFPVFMASPTYLAEHNPMPVSGKAQTPDHLRMGIVPSLYQAYTPIPNLELEASVHKNSWCRTHASKGGRGDIQLPQIAMEWFFLQLHVESRDIPRQQYGWR